MKEKDTFTAREVAAFLEDMRGEFRSVSEVVLPLREDMAEVKDRLTRVEERLIGVEDIVRLAIPDLNRKVPRLETKAQ